MKRYAALFFAVLLLFSLTSCAYQEEKISCREIILTLTESEISLPAGKIYDGSAREGDEEYLPDSMIAALLGGGSMPEIAEGWLDCAFFLPLADHPCEFAVIFCKDSDTALDTAKLLSAHLNYVKLIKSSEQHQAYFSGALVTVVGNYAILIISSDSETALKQVKKLIS